MKTKGEILATGDLRTDKVTKTEQGLELALRASAEKDREDSNLSIALAQKLRGFGFVQNELPTRRPVTKN